MGFQDALAAKVSCDVCDRPAGQMCYGTNADFHYARNDKALRLKEAGLLEDVA